MKSELEFHDSTLAMIAEEDGVVVVCFRPAYVRVEEDGLAAGFEQDVDIRFVRARMLSRPTKMPVWIADAAVKTKAGAVFDALMPIPHSISDELLFSGITAESEPFQIEAAGCRIEPIGERRFIEKIT